MASIDLHDVTVRRGRAIVLDSIDLHVDDGELVGIVGPSGAGKSCLLRVVAGLDEVASGSIAFDGRDVTRTSAGDRNVSMVFQQPALLPHLDVRGNVAFPLEVRHTRAGEIRTRVDAELRALHIEALLARPTDQLSAGEAQLVQIARAMVRVPSVLLLDEPLEPLDAATRQRMRHDLKVLQRGYAVTTLWTTNDPVETMSLPDRVVVLVEGRMRQVGSPIDVYARPVDLVTAQLTGELSVLECTVEADSAGGYWLVHPGFRHRAWAPVLGDRVGGRVLAGLRPEAIELTDSGPVAATVALVQPHGATSSVRCRVGADVVVASAGRHGLTRGDVVKVRFGEMLLFDAVSGRRLV